MTGRNTTDNLIAAWLTNEAAPGAPERLLASSRARIQSTQQRDSWLPRPLVIATNRVVSFALAAAVVAVIAVVGIGLWATGSLGGVGGVPAATPSPNPTPSAELPGIPGLPPEGAAASDTGPGDLVLTFGSGATRVSLWLYNDGRLVSNGFYSSRSSSTGFTVQHLTPSGVDYLLSAANSTGLFESDLMLLRDDEYAPFLQVRLLKGDSFVTVTWAWSGIAGSAPAATAGQATALTSLMLLFSEPDSWPQSAWQDATFSDFVPAEYVVCFGSLHPEGAPTPRPLNVLTLLPDGARALLRLGDQTHQEEMHGDYGCARLATDDAITVARMLDAAGIERNRESGYLQYHMQDPGSPSTIVIQFGAVLPNDQAVYLGPG